MAANRRRGARSHRAMVFGGVGEPWPGLSPRRLPPTQVVPRCGPAARLLPIAALWWSALAVHRPACRVGAAGWFLPADGHASPQHRGARRIASGLQAVGAPHAVSHSLVPSPAVSARRLQTAARCPFL